MEIADRISGGGGAISACHTGVISVSMLRSLYQESFMPIMMPMAPSQMIPDPTHVAGQQAGSDFLCWAGWQCFECGGIIVLLSYFQHLQEGAIKMVLPRRLMDPMAS